MTWLRPVRMITSTIAQHSREAGKEWSPQPALSLLEGAQAMGEWRGN